MLIPRPHSFLMNSLLFTAGLLFAWLDGYGRQAVDGETGMPIWLFILLWFLIQELLVQQAKYMLNDIRDHKRDQKIPANRIRPIAQRPPSNGITILMVGRWILGIILAALLSPVLLTVVLMLSGLQLLYEFEAKPNAATRPFLPMFVVGSGIVLKTLAGALALSVPPGEQRMWLYGLTLFATGVVFISSFWRVEAAYFGDRGLSLPRGQSAYYAQNGLAWLKAGMAVTIVICTILIFDGYSNFLGIVEIHAGLALSLIIVGGIIFCCLSFWLQKGRKAVRAAAVLLYFVASAAYLFFGIEHLIPVPNQVFAATLLLFVLLFDYRINYNLDYKQQNLIYLLENWPQLKRLARERPPDSSTLIHWRHLLQLTLVLNTPKFEAIRQRQERELLAQG